MMHRRDVALGVPLTLASAMWRGRPVRGEADPGALVSTGQPVSSPTAVRVRRSFADARDGQLHVRLALQARDASRVPLVCVHDAPSSGRMFLPWLTAFGGSRDVLAPDLPGYGDSDAPSSPPSIGDYAWAVGQLVDSLGLRQMDLLGVGVGALVAVDMAVTRTALVRRLVLARVPLASGRELAERRAALAPPIIDEAGAHWLRAWAAAWVARTDGRSAAEAFADHVSSGERDWWGPRAAFDYQTADQLPHVTQPALVLRVDDEWADASARAAARLSAGELSADGLAAPRSFASAPDAFIATARAFLDRK